MSKTTSSRTAGPGPNSDSTPSIDHASRLTRHVSRFTPHSSRLTPHASLITLLLLATFLRFYQLPVLPPGLNFDEAGNGVAALDILNGAPRLWWTIGGGKEPLWPYLVALSTLGLGNVPLGLRFPAAVAGILTVAAVYPLLRTLFQGRQGQLLGLLAMLGLALSAWHLHFSRLGFRAILLPLLSTLSFYFFWRSLTRAKSRFSLALSALFMALAIYAYLAARLLPIVILLYVILTWLSSLRLSRLSPHVSRSPSASLRTGTFHSSLITRHFLYLLLFLAPLIFHFSRYPAEFLARSTTVSIFNSAWNNGDLIGVAWQTLALTLGTFLGLSGDPNPLANLPGQPAIPLFLAPFFLLGLIASLYHAVNPAKFAGARFISDGEEEKLGGTTPQAPRPAALSTHLKHTKFADTPEFSEDRQTTKSAAIQPPPSLPLPGGGASTSPPSALSTPPVNPSNSTNSTNPTNSPSPHLLLLCWWTIMLLPAILAPEGAPHHLRLIGTIVPAYAFIALGFVTIIEAINRITRFALHGPHLMFHVSRFFPQSSRLRSFLVATGYLLPAICYLLLGLQTYTHYFIRWPQSADFTLPFDLYAVRLAADIAQAGPEIATVLPMDIRAADEARHYTLDYLLAGSPAAYTYLPVDEHHAETGLTQAASRHDRLHVVRWTADKHHEADAKEIVTFLLQTQAQPLERISFPVYDLERAAVISDSEFALPDIDRPIGANFEGLLRLDAAYLPETAAPGGWLPVALTLAPLAAMEVDYKASVRLISPGGERLAQKDRTLRHNFHQGTSLWPRETVNEYYLLPLPADAPPGDYTVTLVLYHPDTLAPLVANGQAEVPLGTVRLGEGVE